MARKTGDIPLQPIFIEAEPAMISAVRLPRAAMMRTSFPFITITKFRLRFTVAAKNQVYPIRSAGVMKQNWLPGHVAMLPVRSPGLTEKFGCQLIAQSLPITALRLASAPAQMKYDSPAETVYITERGVGRQAKRLMSYASTLSDSGPPSAAKIERS